ncbi:TetR/AcrR family transcriptional regulator [Paracoccus beibuensis]|uniref:TetR/AcrR family transcriptional regulator n=1 Tax=Paracoccus beibuensis TaxID=547602 RepID=UPI00223F5934|nr:TetR-like C-terminal domain-containing protein [Paracoccus beibuensis]
MAARAGVSHAAPAHHFRGLPGLRNAVANQGFTWLRRDLSGATRDIQDAFERLLALCHAYIRFADAHSALFRLMFQELSKGEASLRCSAASAYQLLHEARAQLHPSRGSPASEVAILSMVHGYAMMGLGQPRPPDSPLPQVELATLLRLLVQDDQQPVT